jgi:glutathione S-transferase
MSLTLYFAAGSCSLPALVGLEEAGATFDAVRLVLPDGDQHRAEYLAIHPRGRVPVLVVDGVAVGENIAVLTAIDRLFPQARLLPSDDAVRLAHAYAACMSPSRSSAAPSATPVTTRPGRR